MLWKKERERKYKHWWGHPQEKRWEASQERKTNLTDFAACLGLTWKRDSMEVFFREEKVEFRVT